MSHKHCAKLGQGSKLCLTLGAVNKSLVHTIDLTLGQRSRRNLSTISLVVPTSGTSNWRRASYAGGSKRINNKMIRPQHSLQPHPKALISTLGAGWLTPSALTEGSPQDELAAPSQKTIACAVQSRTLTASDFTKTGPGSPMEQILVVGNGTTSYAARHRPCKSSEDDLCKVHSIDAVSEVFIADETERVACQNTSSEAESLVLLACSKPTSCPIGIQMQVKQSTFLDLGENADSS